MGGSEAGDNLASSTKLSSAVLISWTQIYYKAAGSQTAQSDIQYNRPSSLGAKWNTNLSITLFQYYNSPSGSVLSPGFMLSGGIQEKKLDSHLSHML